MNDTDIFVPEAHRWHERIGKKWSRYDAEVLPCWVADMDFVPMRAIRDSLRVAAEIADLGYPPISERSGLPEAFAAWALRRWRWAIDPGHVHLSPDVVGGIDNCIEALTAPGDGVVVQTPIYPPFMGSVRAAGRRLVEHPLVAGQIDFDALAQLLAAQRPRMLLLCNPHNPSGRCFTAAELSQLGALAERNDVIVVSDEIHGDLVFDGRTHVPFASLDRALAARTITLSSASKAFNIAGLRLAVCHVSNERLRGKLLALPPHRWAAYSTLAVRATLAAWTADGERWLAQCVAHLQAMRDRLAARLPGILYGAVHRPPEATYLSWIDCRQIDFGAEPAQFLLERARVAVSPGGDFGAPGVGHIRINFATSAPLLDEIMSRIGRACAGLHAG